MDKMDEIYPSVEELIVTRLKKRGAGCEDSPVRGVLQIFTKGGGLIAENDIWLEEKLASMIPEINDALSSGEKDPTKPLEVLAKLQALLVEKTK